jgi:hypothetical protein
LNITGGNTTIAAVCGEYSSISSFGNTQSATGNDQFPVGTVATQDANNFVLSAQAIACSSGDTFTAIDGTNRNSSVPAATAVGCALADKSSIAQATLKVTEQVTQGARQWATASVEARLAAGNDTVGALPSKSPNTEISPNVQMIQMNAVSNPNSGYTA